jgi:hypothetical protein
VVMNPTPKRVVFFIHAPQLSVSIIKVASVQLSIQMKPDNNSTESLATRFGLYKS